MYCKKKSFAVKMNKINALPVEYNYPVQKMSQNMTDKDAAMWLSCAADPSKIAIVNHSASPKISEVILCTVPLQPEDGFMEHCFTEDEIKYLNCQCTTALEKASFLGGKVFDHYKFREQANGQLSRATENQMKKTSIDLTEEYVRMFHLHVRAFVEALAAELDLQGFKDAGATNQAGPVWVCKVCGYQDDERAGYHHMFGCQSLNHLQRKCWKRIAQRNMDITREDFYLAMRWIMRKPFAWHEGIALRVKLLYLDCMIEHWLKNGLQVNLRATSQGEAKVCPVNTIGSPWEKKWKRGLFRYNNTPGDADPPYPWAKYGKDPGQRQLFTKEQWYKIPEWWPTCKK